MFCCEINYHRIAHCIPLQTHMLRLTAGCMSAHWSCCTQLRLVKQGGVCEHSVGRLTARVPLRRINPSRPPSYTTTPSEFPTTFQAVPYHNQRHASLEENSRLPVSHTSHNYSQRTQLCKLSCTPNAAANTAGPRHTTNKYLPINSPQAAPCCKRGCAGETSSCMLGSP